MNLIRNTLLAAVALLTRISTLILPRIKTAGAMTLRQFRLLAFLAIAGFIVFWATYMTATHSLITLSAITETIDQQIIAAQHATFALDKAEDLSSGECVTDLKVRPNSEANVNYLFDRAGDLIVTVVGTVDIISKQQPDPVTRDWISLKVSRTGNECSISNRVRLPINGYVQFGQQVSLHDGRDTDTSMFREGVVRVYGRSSAIDWGPLEPGGLYLAKEITLPGGSHIAFTVDAQKNTVAWWGFADYSADPTSDDALQITASTNANALGIFGLAPKAGEYHKRNACVPATLGPIEAIPVSLHPDCIMLDLTARLAGDPNLLWIFGVALIIMFLLEFNENTRSLAPRRNENKEES